MRLLAIILCCFAAPPIVRADSLEDAVFKAIKQLHGKVEQNGKIVDLSRYVHVKDADLKELSALITLSEYVSNTETEWYVRRNVYSALVLFFGSDEERDAELNTTAQARIEGKNSIDPRVIERCIAADYTSDHPELKYGKRE